MPAVEYIYPDSPPRYDGMKLIFAGVAERLGKKEVTIGGRKSVRYTYGLEGDNTEHYYLPIEAEQTVIITVSSTFDYESRERSPSEEIVDQILSTFRFVDE